VLLIGTLMDLLDATVGNVALPVVRRDTGASHSFGLASVTYFVSTGDTATPVDGAPAA
jgi:hypothetical protein